MASFDPDKKGVILLGAIPTWLTAIAGFSFIVANSKLIDLLNASIRRDYFTPELLTQLCATELLASNGIDEMLARFRVFHRQRIEDVNRILMSNLGDICSWSLPGSFGCIWLKVNECVNCDRMYRTRQDVSSMPKRPAQAMSKRNLMGVMLPVWWLGVAETCEPITTAG